MIQSNEQENNKKYKETYEQMTKSYFGKGKLYNFWIQQLSIIINNNINYNFIYQQEVRVDQQYTPQKDEIIFIGEKQKLDELYICQLQEQKLAPINFKLLQSSQIFWLVWIKCLRQELKSSKIGKRIGQFCGYDCLDLIDISNPRFESYISIKNENLFIIKSNRYEFCLLYNDDQQNQKYINFEIRKLDPEVIRNITVGQLVKERIFFSGTENFEIQNELICNLQKIESTQLKEKAYDFLEFQSEYRNPLLITVKSSHIKLLLVPNQQNDYQCISDDDDFQPEFQKYYQILPILKFINGNWQIEHNFLCRKIEKNQSETIKQGRIITQSNKGISDHELQFDWKTKLIQFNSKI